MKNYKSEWLAACFGDALTNGKTVIAYFNNGHEPAEYGADLLPLLATDNTVQNIIDGYTGELIYTRR